MRICRVLETCWTTPAADPLQGLDLLDAERWPSGRGQRSRKSPGSPTEPLPACPLFRILAKVGAVLLHSRRRMEISGIGFLLVSCARNRVPERTPLTHVRAAHELERARLVTDRVERDGVAVLREVVLGLPYGVDSSALEPGERTLGCEAIGGSRPDRRLAWSGGPLDLTTASHPILFARSFDAWEGAERRRLPRGTRPGTSDHGRST